MTDSPHTDESVRVIISLHNQFFRLRRWMMTIAWPGSDKLPFLYGWSSPKHLLGDLSARLAEHIGPDTTEPKIVVQLPMSIYTRYGGKPIAALFEATYPKHNAEFRGFGNDDTIFLHLVAK